MNKWENINKELDGLYKSIFQNIDVNDLDSYTKRKIIFEYLCNNIIYDFELLEKIKHKKSNAKYKIERNQYDEIYSIFKYNKGICNSISQVYKLLLEKVNIYSICVFCNDGTEIIHQLNLVYEEANDSFSFDDITGVIVGRGNKQDFFDYDIEDANKNNQGNKPIYHNNYWMCLPTEHIYNTVGRKNYDYLKYNYESNVIVEMPQNIISNKKQIKQKRN